MGKRAGSVKVSENDMTRILNIIGGVGYGGAETFLMNIYRRIDRDQFQFDFIICEKVSDNSYASEIEKLGGRIYCIPSKKENIFKNLYCIYTIVKENNYKIVWRHTYNMFKALDLVVAKIAGADVTILHAHSTNAKKIESKLGKVLRPFINPFITTRFACGNLAGDFLFGKKTYKIVSNGIVSDGFLYNEDIRKEYRKQFSVDNKFVVGHIGRFTKAKNHEFLIEIFKRILEHDKEAYLILIGTGELEDSVKQKANLLGISENVLFLETRNDVGAIMQAMDVFLMPSLWEGIPVTLVEAQAADLPCVISDTIDPSVKFTENIVFESLDENAEKWAETVIAQKREVRRNRAEDVVKAGYDINEVVTEIEKYFKKIII